jgi:hypothetical protein
MRIGIQLHNGDLVKTTNLMAFGRSPPAIRADFQFSLFIALEISLSIS